MNLPMSWISSWHATTVSAYSWTWRGDWQMLMTPLPMKSAMPRCVSFGISQKPRRAGREPALDAALQAMHQEHQKHEPQLKSLLNTCQTLHASPQRLEELRETLRATAMALEQDFIIHLQQEEKVVMPAIRSLLTSEDRDAMLAELRARRLMKD